MNLRWWPMVVVLAVPLATGCASQEPARQPETTRAADAPPPDDEAARLREAAGTEVASAPPAGKPLTEADHRESEEDEAREEAFERERAAAERANGGR